METILLAITKPKQSWTKVGLEFYKEYSVGISLTEAEKENIYRKFGRLSIYSANPVITLRRRVDKRGEILSYWPYDILDVCESFEKAVMSFGDGEYLQGVSVDSAHKEYLEKLDVWKELNKELEEKETYLKGDKFNKSAIVEKYNGLYEEELKSRRLWSKAKKGTAPQNIVDEISAHLKEEYNQEKSECEMEINVLKEKIDEIGI